MKKETERRSRALLLPLLVLLGFLGACGGNDDNGTNPKDTTPPAAISTLTKGPVTSSSVLLSWTVPGDDGTSGTADRYDLRYSTHPITEANFDSATAVTSSLPHPTAPGISQTYMVTGLAANTLYYFALKTADEVPNWSGISNVVPATTPVSTDATPPNAVSDLRPGTVTPSSIALHWTAPGDDHAVGLASSYEIRYSTDVITESNFDQAEVVTNPPHPSSPGHADSVTVGGLEPHTTYYFALKTADEVPNWSDLSNVLAATTVSSGDVTGPEKVSDLAATAADSTTVDLTWSAPSDEGISGRATSYDIRYSTAPLDSANWASATLVDNEPAPGAAGASEEMAVAGLHSNTDYWFALESLDQSGNRSGISNVAHVHTPASSNPSSPPGIQAPSFPTTVCISSQDQFAQYAKALAQGQLGMLQGLSAAAGSFFVPLGSADWVRNGDCWNYGYPYQGCSGTYQVCPSGSLYTYTYTVNGSCGGQTYNNWVAFQVDLDQAVRRGTFSVFDTNTANVVNSWVWTWAADNNSGHYDFFQGAPNSNPEESLDWSRSSDSNTYDLTFVQPGTARWESHIVQDPCSGRMQLYDWDSSLNAWWRTTDIAWSPDGTGYFDTYDEDGTLAQHHQW